MPGPIIATLRFLGPHVGKPVAYGRQREKDNLPLVDQNVPLEDLRGREAGCDLEREGFCVRIAPTGVHDFLDAEARHRVYMPELEALIRDLTGAEKTLALGSSVVRRSERSEGYLASGTSVPGRFVHCDYSTGPAGSLYWLDRALDAGEAAWRRQRRFAIYNVWRAISPPPHDTPLALCDVRTLATGDAVTADCVCDPEDEPEWSFENTLYRYGPSQRWLYVSDLRPEEVLVFKGCDSDPTRTQGVPHGAFDDPSCPTGAPARESIDERVIAFF